MSRHKTPRLSARNWDALIESADDFAVFEKVRAVSRPLDASLMKPTRERPRQNFHRPRFG